MALAVLVGAGFNALPSLGSEQLVVQVEGSVGAADINRILAHEGLFAHAVSTETVSLEDAFLSLTAKPSIDTSIALELS